MEIQSVPHSNEFFGFGTSHASQPRTRHKRQSFVSIVGRHCLYRSRLDSNRRDLCIDFGKLELLAPNIPNISCQA
jgi:hypothetical protein